MFSISQNHAFVKDFVAFGPYPSAPERGQGDKETRRQGDGATHTGLKSRWWVALGPSIAGFTAVRLCSGTWGRGGIWGGSGGRVEHYHIVVHRVASQGEIARRYQDGRGVKRRVIYPHPGLVHADHDHSMGARSRPIGQFSGMDQGHDGHSILQPAADFGHRSLNIGNAQGGETQAEHVRSRGPDIGVGAQLTREQLLGTRLSPVGHDHLDTGWQATGLTLLAAVRNGQPGDHARSTPGLARHRRAPLPSWHPRPPFLSAPPRPVPARSAGPAHARRCDRR